MIYARCEKAAQEGHVVGETSRGWLTYEEADGSVVRHVCPDCMTADELQGVWDAVARRPGSDDA